MNLDRQLVAVEERPPDESANGSQDDADVHAPKGVRAFIRIPNVVVRDKRLDAAALVVLSFRATFLGRYGLSEANLAGVHAKNPIVKAGTGLGINNFRKAISTLVELGYLKRWQPPAGGPESFARALDRPQLPPCGSTGYAGRHLKRQWFDASLSLNGLAAFLYLRAGTGDGPRTYLSELQQRFEWSRPTAGKAVHELMHSGLANRATERRQDGRIDGVTYEVNLPSQWLIWRPSTTVKKPCNGLPCGGATCNTHTSNPPHILPTGELPSQTANAAHCPSPDGAGRAADFEDQAGESFIQTSAQGQRFGIDFGGPLPEAENEPTPSDDAWKSKNLLGGIEDGSGHLSPDLWEVDGETFQAVAETVGNAELRSRLREAARGRISPEILSGAGLYAVRWLAALAMTTAAENAPDGEEYGPEDALNLIITSIDDRIGKSNPPEWIHSLALIAQRLTGAAYDHGFGNSLYQNKQGRR